MKKSKHVLMLHEAARWSIY